MFETYLTWREEDGRRVRWVLDQNHVTVGSYGYETEEETKAAEDYEAERLEDGRWVVLGCIVERPCTQCGQWVEVDSLWGIVIEPDETELRKFRKESMQ
jgi:hypothetical protein